MKNSFIAASLAAAALANPLDKRWQWETTWEVTVTTVTVTGTPPAAAPTQAGEWFSQGWGQGWSSSEAAATTAAPAPTSEAPAPSAPAESPSSTWADWSSAPASAASSAPVSSGTVSSDYAQGILDAHNSHRQNSSAPALTWSDDMASIAQQIASSCVYAHNTQAGGGGYGQNIGAGAEPSGIPAMINNEMYNGEINYYPLPYGAEPDMSNFEKWGHYSQIVWKSTTQVGCATVNCPGGLANTGSGVSPWFTVCNYSPPGNFGGEYGANVGQPGDMPTVTL